MNFKQSVPVYLTSRKNTIIQIAFTTVFAYIFIIIYRPFGYDNWYKINEWELLLASAAVVVAGMILVILSRILLFILKKSHDTTLALYIWLIVAEVISMGFFYTSLEIFILKDQRPAFSLFLNAVQNTALILLIPYTLSFLFFAWTDIKRKLEQLPVPIKDPSEIFIPFKDEKGILRITLKCLDVLFMESSDNYVIINYTDNTKRKTFLIRNTLKNMEKELKDYYLFRNHRKFSVNIKNVKQLKKTKKGYELIINSEKEEKLPVSKSYEKRIMELLNIK